MLAIGSVPVRPPLMLAPMAGVTDRDFRLVVKLAGGCGLVSMEFISSEGLTRSHPSTLRKLHINQEERPVAVQVYGSDPGRIAEAARIVEAMGADICDINMGCPANKILRGCAGAALMADLPRARAVVRAVRRAVSIPVTVKFRLGIRGDAPSYLELGAICQDEGADAVALHPRTAAQQFSGASDWSHIALLKEALAIPVVGNGDVTSPEDAVRMFRETSCDAVMIGRASLVNPWIFRQAAALLHGEQYQEASLQERLAMIRSHFQAVLQRENEKIALHKLRSFTGWYTHGLPDGRLLRRQLSALTDGPSVLAAVEDFFAERIAA